MNPFIDYKKLFDVAPTPYLILAPDFTIVDVNQAYLKVARRQREEMVGLSVFDALSGNFDEPDACALRTSLERVLATGEPDALTRQCHPISHCTTEGKVFRERYWSALNTPLRDAGGNVCGICHSPIDAAALHGTQNETDAAAHIASERTEAGLFMRSQIGHTKNRKLDAERRHLLQLFDQAPGFVCFTHGSQHVVELGNQALNRLTGGRELLGKPLREVFPELESQGIFALLDQAYRSGKPVVGKELQFFLQEPSEAGRREICVDFSCQPIVEEDGAVSGICLQGHDITELKRIERELRIGNERWEFVLRGSGDSFWDWNVTTDELVLSLRWIDMFGFDSKELPSRMQELTKRIHPEDRARVLVESAACLDGTSEAFSSEYRLLCKDESWKRVLGRGKVVSRDSDGRPLRMTGTVTDIEERKRSEERVWRQGHLDNLTGLPNRRLFRDYLNREARTAQRSGAPFALLLIDLDRFKEANDWLGHDVGDILLAQAAKRITAAVRATDIVARLGGDEFTVILKQFDTNSHVGSVAQKILDALAKPFLINEELIYLSGSIGITLCPTDAVEPEHLMRHADQAMYVAKQAGKNQFSYFRMSMQESAHSRLRMISELRGALPGKQLKVYFQPIVDLADKRIVKAEALLRWFHPEHGLCYPSSFVPLAEETGLINDIGDWVFMESALWSQRWGNLLGEPFQISVNKSPVQFHAERKDQHWRDYLNDLGLSRNSISVEITESILLNASSNVSETLLEYRDAGIQVALDDFGTGYSSMSYLKKFDIDYLKIDQSFVHDMTSNPGSRTIAETIIMMAHKLGLKVIAEGIETPEQRDLLVAAGCDFGQGFLFSQAIAPEEFEALLHDGTVFA
ncbi:MAG TPA: EAL domain-containing protein [Burkholderiaceae bacterium]|nr:EAL domain-containing protein [Burkholderiaceae bacterium]